MHRLTLLFALFLLAPSPVLAGPTAGPTFSLPDLSESASHAGKKGKKAKKAKKAKKGKKGKKNAEPPPPPPDADGDGVPDETDACVDEAEDIDLFEDSDGCPDNDNDGDEIPDAEDDCPDEAETVDGWTDEDGCPETAPAIAPMKIDATLQDGTRVKGTVIRITAIDEDEPTSEPTEPTELEVVAGEVNEFSTGWSNVRSLKAEKGRIPDDFDCYSEGVQEIGEAPIWECTLKHPVRIGLSSSDHRGKHYVVDRKMQRMDFQIDGLECSGSSCEGITASRTLSIYLYKLIAFEQNEDEFGAVRSLQEKLGVMQKLQLKSATLSPAGD